MNTEELIQENLQLKDMLENLSKTHATDMQRLSDMIDFRNNAIRKMRDAKGRYHTELACRALFAIIPEHAKNPDACNKWSESETLHPLMHCQKCGELRGMDHPCDSPPNAPVVATGGLKNEHE